MGAEQLLDESANPRARTAPEISTPCRSTQQRVPADAEILAVLIGTLTPSELARIAATVSDVLRDRERAWIRHPGEHEHWHAIAEIRPTTYQTMCGGSMPFSVQPDVEARPARADRCELCQQRYAERRLVEVGLRELVSNTEEA
jgi:hypothetical protein